MQIITHTHTHNTEGNFFVIPDIKVPIKEAIAVDTTTSVGGTPEKEMINMISEINGINRRR
jgi:hypothetical protein